MCVPAGLLTITTDIVLYANSTVTKREQKFYVHNVHYLAMQWITYSMLTWISFSFQPLSKLTSNFKKPIQCIFTMLIT